MHGLCDGGSLYQKPKRLLFTAYFTVRGGKKIPRLRRSRGGLVDMGVGGSILWRPLVNPG